MDQVRQIARAVLYEGYLLWPYRESSLKNQHRWTIGGVHPEGSGDRSRIRTECLVEADPETGVNVCVRFLHTLSRQHVAGSGRGEEAREHEVNVPELVLGAGPVRTEIDVPEGEEREGNVVRHWKALHGHAEASAEQLGPRLFRIRADVANTTPWRPNAAQADAQPQTMAPPGAMAPPEAMTPAEAGALSGAVAREEGRPDDTALPEARVLSGEMASAEVGSLPGEMVLPGAMARREARAEGRPDDIALREAGAMAQPELMARAEGRAWAIARAFVSAHVVLHAPGGRFVSLMDPPEELRGHAEGCRNDGLWPVLAGEDLRTVLSAPIILYDQPRIAPESPGDLFDATEIDQLLTLCVLALSDEEQAEIRDGDPRAREILDRCTALTQEELMRLHGTWRETEPRG